MEEDLSSTSTTTVLSGVRGGFLLIAGEQNRYVEHIAGASAGNVFDIAVLLAGYEQEAAARRNKGLKFGLKIRRPLFEVLVVGDDEVVAIAQRSVISAAEVDRKSRRFQNAFEMASAGSVGNN